MNNTHTEVSTYNRILNAAIEIISQQGLKGLSASKLATTANISKSTVFHHFKKMDEVPALVLKKLYDEIFLPLQNDKYNNVYDYLKVIGQASFSKNVEYIMIYKAFVSLIHASMHDAQLQDIVNGCSELFSSQLSTKIQELCNNQIDPNTLKKLSQLIIKTLDGICLHYLINSDQADAFTSWDIFIHALVTNYQLL